MIDAAVLERIKQGTDLVQLVGEVVVLRRSGSGGRHKGLCCFHDDRSPSLEVVPGKQMWICNACGAAGDAVEFVMKSRGIGFREAVAELARRMGMDLGEGEAGKDESPEAVRARAAALEAWRHEVALAKAKREAEAERYRQGAINAAHRVWQAARGGADKLVVGTAPGYLDGSGEDHPRVAEYISARGVDVTLLPGGRVPKMLRYSGSVYRSWTDESGKHEDRCPALVGGVVNAEREMVGVQRIYLDPAGAPTKVQVGESKKTLGSVGGGAVRLAGGELGAGVLVVTEGIETGCAVLAATQRPVWAALSTAGLEALELPAEAVVGGREQSARSAWIRGVIIAGDHDRLRKVKREGKWVMERPGNVSAVAAAERLRGLWPGLPVGVALPTHDLVPELIAADGTVSEACGGGKSCDWLDVLRAMGPTRMREAVLGVEMRAVRAEDGAGGEWVASESGAGEGDDGGDGDGGSGAGAGGGDDVEGERPIVPATGTDRAKVVLRRLFEPSAVAKDGEVGASWMLRRFAARWYVWSPVKRAYQPVEDEELRGRVRLLLDGYDQIDKRTKKPKPFAPSDRNVDDIMRAAIVWTSGGSGSMPKWLERDFDEGGAPVWRAAVRVAHEETEAVDPIEPVDVLATRSGLLDVAAWVDGRVRVLPPTPRWFSRSCVPVAIGPELQGWASDEHEQTWARLQTMCPRWLAFLSQVFESDDDSIACLQEWFGYCLTSDTRYQKLLWLQGPPGGGKGTICRMQTHILGKDNVASTDIESLAGRFELGALVGKNVVYLPEVRVSARTDQAGALNRLLSISGGDAQRVEDKFAAIQTEVQISAKFVITPNEEPRLPDASAAIARRLLVLPTGRPVEEPDPLLGQKLEAETVGVLVWALLGLRRLRKRGAFVQPAAGRELMREIVRGMSPLKAFVEDQCHVGAQQAVKTDVLYQIYQQWAAVNGHTRDLSQATFGRQLRAAVPGVSKVEMSRGLVRMKAYVGVRPRVVDFDVDEHGRPRVLTVDSLHGVAEVDGYQEHTDSVCGSGGQRA